VKPQIKLSIPRQAEPKPDVAKAVKPVSPVQEVDEPEGVYKLPSMDLLQTAPLLDQSKMKSSLEDSSKVLEDTLRDFGIDAKVVEVEQGPTITRYELQPAAGVKVQKITSLENDISLAMRATSVRIVAPIPGKNRVGIEVPNISSATVYIKEVLESPEYQNERSKISIVIGKDTAGAPIVCNLADMPHLLIAGATNTGKSVCINTVITSILFKSTPDEVKFLMIDPKMVELHFYNDLPHLICPVVTDKSKAPGALAWLLGEMERRYKVLSRVSAKNILGFNEKVANKLITAESVTRDESNADEPILVKKMPYIVLIIDELADLMMSSANEVETSITRLAQLARAVGIHMILATQRPSVDVITGVIKANFPARIAFQVASKVDSRTILDENGADKLLGRGDLLLMDPRKSKLIRAQGAWVQDAEIEKITTFIKGQRKAAYQEGIIQSADKGKTSFGEFKRDEVYDEAKRVVLETGQASVSMIQRRLGLGYTRAARLVDMMEEDGVVGPYRGAKPREILIEHPKNTATAEPVHE
jgi:S-DNA-T family DNA segregation ATPase FtsK/SpoIIIE